MLGLEPGDEPFASAALPDRPEAHEGAHLVHVAAHAAGEFVDASHIQVGAVVQDARSSLQPPQQAVEQREPLRVRMQDGALSQFDEASAGTNPRRSDVGQGQAVRRKKAARRSGLDPADALRRHAALHERPRPLAPAREVVGFGHLDEDLLVRAEGRERGHAANSSSCSLRGASSARRSARSVSSVGRQSAATMNGRTLAIEPVSRATSSSRSRR